MIRRVPSRYVFLVALLLIVGLLAPLPFVLVEPGTPDNIFGQVSGSPILKLGYIVSSLFVHGLMGSVQSSRVRFSIPKELTPKR